MLTTYMPHSAEPMARSLMKRYGLLDRQWSYDYGVVWRGMEALYALTGERAYYDYILRAVDSFVDGEGHIRDYDAESFNLDFICNGRQLLYLYKQTGEERYRLAADRLREQLRRQPRTSEGGFWHKRCYPWQMWLDGLHMAAPFYVEYCLMTDDPEGVRDAAHQLALVWRRTFNPATGLNHHAWDEARAQPWADPQTGLSPHAWGRAMGWYMLGLADVLALLPDTHPDFDTLLDIFTRTLEKLMSIRVDGVWMQVLDQPGRTGNYKESSASCLIVAAALKMANLGRISDALAREAEESFRAIQREFVGQMRDGTLFLGKCCSVAGLGGASGRDGSFDYYMSEPVAAWDLKGTGAYLQAACEMEKRGSHDVG